MSEGGRDQEVQIWREWKGARIRGEPGKTQLSAVLSNLPERVLRGFRKFRFFGFLNAFLAYLFIPGGASGSLVKRT